MKESCSDCGNIICIDNKNETRIVAGIKGGIIYENIKGSVKNCPFRKGTEEEDINKWFELEGKVDTLNLGC